MKKATKEQLDEFYLSVDQKKDSTSEEKRLNPSLKSEVKSLPYQCPRCHKLLSSRKEPCKYCNYTGYIPMSEDETKKIRKTRS